MSYRSLWRRRSLCCPCPAGVSQWTSPCSLCPVCQRLLCSPAFHFKYRNNPPTLECPVWECASENCVFPERSAVAVFHRVWSWINSWINSNFPLCSAVLCLFLFACGNYIITILNQMGVCTYPSVPVLVKGDVEIQVKDLINNIYKTILNKKAQGYLH